MKAVAPFFAAVLAALASTAHAGMESKESKETVVATPFDKGKLELQIAAGAFTSIQSDSTTRPRITDIDAALRLGTMLYAPTGEGCLRGNLECMAELYGAGLVEGPRSGYAGVTLVLRYNFVQPSARWVPYFQIQAGGVYDDIYRDSEQRVFGRSVEFDLGGGFGLRYLCSDRAAFFIEADYRHVSNANTADRNLGLNSVGGFLGASCFF